MVSPFLGIPVSPFFWSTFLGSMPYNFICAQAGAVLGELSSTADIISASLIIKLLGVSFISLVPVIWGKKLKRLMKRYIGAKDDDEQEEENIDENNRRLLDDDDLEKADEVMELDNTSYSQDRHHHHQQQQ